jgi:ribonuclease inhibitor
MKVIYLNGSNIWSKSDLHSELADQMRFPWYYGRNLDALYDLLSTEREHCLFIIKNKEELAENLGGYYFALTDVLEDVSRENDRIAWMTAD